MRLILNVYGNDSEKYKSTGDNDGELNMINKICEALCLVQNDYIGGKRNERKRERAIRN